MTATAGNRSKTFSVSNEGQQNRLPAKDIGSNGSRASQISLPDSLGVLRQQGDMVKLTVSSSRMSLREAPLHTEQSKR